MAGGAWRVVRGVSNLLLLPGQRWNGMLRSAGQLGVADGAFATAIHTFSSGIIKLAHAVPPPGPAVYRAMGGARPGWLEVGAGGCGCGWEPGFLSATRDREKLGHGGPGGVRLVEVRLAGTGDGAASLEPVTQFPGTMPGGGWGGRGSVGGGSWGGKGSVGVLWAVSISNPCCIMGRID